MLLRRLRRNGYFEFPGWNEVEGARMTDMRMEPLLINPLKRSTEVMTGPGSIEVENIKSMRVERACRL